MTFEEKIRQLAEGAILKTLSEGQWIQPDYASRVKIPAGFMQEVWELVDTNELKKQMARRIESELADRLMNHIAAEMATDVKKLLSNPERREEIRAIAREHLKALSK